jgi:sigma-B regulation protein RsbU (phosphoserine phosphatase)
MIVASQTDSGLKAQLELARQVQLSLLPDRRCCLSGWEVAFSYEPAGLLSGDYVDLVPTGPNAFYFALGDVSGKGIAASMLMSHLHATLRTLLRLDQSIEEVMKAASRTFCESSLPAQFATLVLGRADNNGLVELVNAGHNPALVLEGNELQMIPAANLPLGMFCSTDFTAVTRSIDEGSTLFLYSDGITESTDESGNEFDLTRLSQLLFQSRHLSASELVDRVRNEVVEFSNHASPGDDRTMLVLRRLQKGT